ncbi:MAG: hypothetical protein KDA92_25175, partial [Planctomycetales bacterium]|nr:hypothetical protein [Planctomycetales bacterium]
VRPDKDYLIEMSPGETRQVLAYQRDRDILLTPSEKASGTAPERQIDRQLQAALSYLESKTEAK